MVDNTVLDVSEILDTFHIDEIRRLIYEQIPLDSEADIYSSENSDYFTPLYQRFIQSAKDIPEDGQTNLSNQFMQICLIYINRICDKFQMRIDDNWLSEHTEQIPAITKALYSFFVLDFCSTLEEMLMKYIYRNKAFLREHFKDLVSKKDSQTLVNKKIIVDEDMVVIVSNIFNIISWIINQLDEDEFFRYANDGDINVEVIDELLESMILSGNPIDAIQEIYNTNLSLRSEIGFYLISKIRKKFGYKKEEEQNE